MNQARSIAPACPHFGRSFRVVRPHPPVALRVGAVVRFVGPASMLGVIVGRGDLTAWFPLANLELVPEEPPDMEAEPAAARLSPAELAEKHANLVWAVAMAIGLVLGFVLFRSPAGPARRAARGEAEEPVARRPTWCPTPELRSSYPVPRPEAAASDGPDEHRIIADPSPPLEADAMPEPALTPPDGRARSDIRLVLRLHAVLGEMADERDAAPAEWRWKPDGARLRLLELLRDVEAGRLGLP